MVKYSFVCLILYHTILISNALPYEKQHQSHTDVQRQKREDVQKSGDMCDSGIIFPDKTKNEECNKKFIATGKGRNCGHNVCEDAIDYPYEQVNKTLSKLALYGDLFGHAEGAQIILGNKNQEQELDNLCTATILTKYPKVLQNEKNVEKFIVNVDGHTQGIIYEMCGDDKKCRFSDLFPSGYISECVQKYVTRRLMALGEDGNPAFDSFVVPSCCVCSTRHAN